MREAVHRFSTDGGVIYAECGGMMYLTQAIRDLDEKRHEMVGLFSAEAVMRRTGLTLGYRTFTIAEPCVLGPVGLTIKGHEFHYSHLVPTGSIRYAGALRSAQGRDTGGDGLIAGRTVALYSHLHFASRPQVARSLVAAARERKGSLQSGRGA
jgi:cobyrinic acid a,c-diamide synthase